MRWVVDGFVAIWVQELTSLWQKVLQALREDDAPSTAESILTLAYFWYNFMPLARGTAAAGYICILGLFLAAGMPVIASIPKARHNQPNLWRRPAVDWMLHQALDRCRRTLLWSANYYSGC